MNQKNINDLDDILTIQELADFLKIRPQTIRNRMSKKTFPIKPFRIGSAVRFYKKELISYISGGEQCQS